MKPDRWIVMVGCLLLGSSLGSVEAGSLTTYVFDGTINRLDNSTGVFDSSIQIGASFTLKVSIPSDTPNDLAGNATFGHYNFPSSTDPGMVLTIGGETFKLGTPGTGQVSVLVPTTGDSFYGYRSFGTPGDPNLNSVRVDFDLASKASHLGTDGLPTAVNLANFPENPSLNLSYFYNDNRAYPGLGGTIQSVQVLSDSVPTPTPPVVPISPSPVPEPSSILIFGAVALGILRYRRTRLSPN